MVVKTTTMQMRRLITRTKPNEVAKHNNNANVVANHESNANEAAKDKNNGK